jgi:hypothetical protein
VSDRSGHLELRFTRDLDDWGDLDVVAEADGFAGRSSATVHSNQLAEFAAALSQDPFDVDQPPTLHGGMRQEDHVRLEVRQVNPRGQIGVTATLMEQWPRSVSRGLQRQSAIVELLTTYERIRRFAEEIAELGDPGSPPRRRISIHVRLEEELLA